VSRRPPARRHLAGQFVVLLVSASCALGPTVTASPSAADPTGGTLRIVLPGDQLEWGRFTVKEGDPATLDPHLDVFSVYDTWELLRCCLARTLLSSNGRATADGGARIHPDLAAALPEISADGLSWTFKLKDGLRYGPPLEDVEITAPDVIRGLHRLMWPALAENSFGRATYPDIVGAQAYLDGEATSISGLESPDRYTVVIRLTKPAGDLGARLALPLAVPIPPLPSDPSTSFGAAEGHDDGYGRFLVSSGPYMVEGSESLDFSLPADKQPALAGLVPGQRITVVRNPSWDQSKDDLRAARPDRIELYIVPTMDDAAREVYEARAQLLLNYGALQQIPNEVADAVRADPGKGRIYVDEADALFGIMMNLAIQPFDDINVRKAVAYAINRARLMELAGGPLVGRVAHHLVPDAMEDNLLVDYRPYATAGDAGDLAAAKEQMKQSAYDTDADGICDADACRDIPVVARSEIPALPESVRDDLAGVGLELDLELIAFEGFFEGYQDPTRQYAMFIPLGWAKDALSPASFFVARFYAPVALAGGQGNGSLVGATPTQLEEWGYEVTEVPSVDAQIEACLPLTGAAQFDCWASLDQHMMENVLPSISFGAGVGSVLASSRVVEYEWDQLAGAPSFDRILVAP
jgi:ABC-type transport system substrate-binding protein